MRAVWMIDALLDRDIILLVFNCADCRQEIIHREGD
jgi:hypothetical protein